MDEIEASLDGIMIMYVAAWWRRIIRKSQYDTTTRELKQHLEDLDQINQYLDSFLCGDPTKDLEVTLHRLRSLKLEQRVRRMNERMEDIDRASALGGLTILW